MPSPDAPVPSTASSNPPVPVDENLPPFRAVRFLVVDDNTDGRFLVSKTLLRKFPNAIMVECQTADAAFRALKAEAVSLIITHRTFELDGASLVKEFRERAPHVPILMMSGIDRRAAALEAGANRFLMNDEWLMVGNVVAEMLLAADEEKKGEGG